MKTVWVILSGFILTGCNVSAETSIPLLESGTNKFTNVVVLQTNVTDIFVKHAHGMGNIKLKSLAPEWQAKFGYDATKAEAAETKQAVATSQYLASFNSQPTEPQITNATAPINSADNTNTNAEPIDAKFFSGKRLLGQKAPELIVETWVTREPDTKGKFVLIDFWATWCGPCRQAIPELNQFHKKFGDRLAVIGMSNEEEGVVRAFRNPPPEYFLGVDSKARTRNTIGITGIPHVILMDPEGIVRWEGFPLFDKHRLTEQVIADILAGR